MLAGQLCAKAGAPAADQVVVADIEVLQRIAERPNRRRMPVSKVEHAAVAVAVPVPAPAVGVAEPRSLALADDDVDAHGRQSVRLAAAHVGGEGRNRLIPAWVRLGSGSGAGGGCGFHLAPPFPELRLDG